MNDYQPLDPEFKKRVRESFLNQKLLNTLNGELTLLKPGEAQITAPFDERFAQQDGFLHAGTITTLIEKQEKLVAVMQATMICMRTEGKAQQH